MARIRSIHPGWFTDEAWVSVSFEARLLGIGLWTECDDQGVFEWKPITIKMRLFPADNLDMAALLAELADADLIRQFSAGGKKYGAVRNFCRFQRPKKPRPVHPINGEFRTYVGSDKPSGELDDIEDEAGGELEEVQPVPIPQKAEKSKQMEVEEEGERNRREKIPAPVVRAIVREASSLPRPRRPCPTSPNSAYGCEARSAQSPSSPT
ncbi:hypothetical protein ACFQE0_26030 [Methylobacterium komagatae]|uniref:DUF1376 domain-containing protein n=1 Tax=Methylobacterium komagatae TaxID=374425 RepID=A0ABW2BQJ3_9HYPH